MRLLPFIAAAGVLALSVTPTPASAAVGYKIVDNQPDEDDLHVSGSLYYALIASNFLNIGAHAQATYCVVPALELQGVGMVNAVGTSFLRLEGSAFLAIPWMRKGRVVLSSYTTGQYTLTNFIEVPEIERAKFGLDVGLLFDRHGVKLNELSDDLSPVRSFGGFAGLKWVFQSKADVAVQGYGTAHKHYRMAYYVHVIRAFTQGFDQPAGLAGTDKEVKGAPLGGRFGMEGKFPGEVGFFIKYEAGAMPSARGADWNMFVFLGASLARPLF